MCLAFFILVAPPAHCEHGDWLMGTDGLLSAQQAPEGVFYSNVWSYYHASSSDFVATGPLKCSPRDHVCLNLNLGGSGSLDEFVDQNVIGWTSPYKVLGANYGLFIDVPFAIADANGSASLEPVLSLNRNSRSLTSLRTSNSVTKGGIADMYVEPVNFGWHLSHLDAIISSGFFAPSGPYRSSALVNIGYGHWTGVFGLGGVAYADAEQTWSLSVYAHYLLYGSQIGRSYTLGDVVPLEWGAGKTFSLKNYIFKEVTLGAAGYAQWQVTSNQIDLAPRTRIATSTIELLEDTRSQIYSAGPSINLLTKYGLFSLRYYEEFGAHATPSGRQLMFSLALAFG
jgi:hypothetical protein